MAPHVPEDLITRIQALERDLRALQGRVSTRAAISTILDALGSIVLAPDPAGGLARPWTTYTAPAADSMALWPSTTAGTWTTIARSRGIVQHPALMIRASLGADPGTTGQLRLSVGGTPVAIGQPGADLIATVPIGAPVGTEVEFTLDAQRVGGSGTVYGVVRYLYGVALPPPPPK
ncbi:hypothetical protein [Kitasatospora sp. NPDC001175]|uniref:hypothetical protein n=1 Tax=Kitasatospora sp. NPDC001175 TaxID=3157103 RepID=UPI003D013415